MRRVVTGIGIGLLLIGLARPSSGVFHLVVLDEVLTSYEGNASVQFVEIRMLASFQNAVANSVLAAFASDGSYIGDILVVPGDVDNSGSGVRWIVGTSAVESELGITPDFIMPSGILPTGGGMVCFGGGGGILPLNPPNWDRTNFTNYVDCLAYGTYSGSSNLRTGTPTSLNGDGHSLQRMGSSSNNNADFVCGDPITPENNAGDEESVAASSPCGGGPTATATGGGGETPTPTPTGVPTGTVAACVGDCTGSGMVEINELIIGVNIALDAAPISQCPSFDCMGTGTVPISCLIQAVNNALAGCPAVQPTPTRTPGGPLGVRRFSLNPDESQFIAVLSTGGGAFPSTGFTGFLELTAGPVNGGVAFIDLTDASEYLSIDVPAGGIAVCLKIPRQQLPVLNAGIISCNGGIPMGIAVTQDHNIGVVGACSGGTNDGQACGDDGDCPEGECFNAADCAAQGGMVEGEDGTHPGVCNGMFVGVPDSEPSGPGTLVLAPAGGLINGFQVELTQEVSTPCGDEGIVGTPVQIGFTSGHSISRVVDFNNNPGEELSGEIDGEPFSCDAFDQEDGPGILVLSATNLDTPIVGGSADIVAQFRFVD